MTRLGATAIAFAALLCGVPATAQDAMIEAGRVEYLSACAGCHGQDARGNGPMADLMRIETPDLTQLSERAGGEFPFRNTLLLIDGRDVRAHGGDMPIWGERLSTLLKCEEATSDSPCQVGDPEFVIKGRMTALTLYLESVQE